MIFEPILTKIYKIQFSVYCNRLPYNIPDLGGFITYFFLGIGSCLGGLSAKYLSKSLIIYEIERSYFLDCSSRNFLISSVVLKFKGTDLMSLLIHTM